MTLRDRVGAWLVTGPVGRLVAFVLDFGAALLDAVRRRARPGRSDREILADDVEGERRARSPRL
jgi:hypothetical protein